MFGKQIEFPPAQRHSRNFELLMIGICIACIIVAVVIAKATDWGVTTRPERSTRMGVALRFLSGLSRAPWHVARLKR